jgi:hypothetical protein
MNIDPSGSRTANIPDSVRPAACVRCVRRNTRERKNGEPCGYLIGGGEEDVAVLILVGGWGGGGSRKKGAQPSPPHPSADRSRLV